MPNFPDLPINGIVQKYRDNFDWLSRATSRDITVFVEPNRTGCPNGSGYDFINRKEFPVYNSNNSFSSSAPTVISSLGISGILNVPFSGGEICPVCNGEGFIYSPSSGTVSARIRWRNEETTHDLEQSKLNKDEFDVRIKVTGDAAKNLLDRSKIVMIDGQSCEVVKVGVPFGLRDIYGYYYFLNKKQ